MALAGASPQGGEFVGWLDIKDPFNVGPEPRNAVIPRRGIAGQPLFATDIGIKVQAIGPIAMPRQGGYDEGRVTVVIFWHGRCNHIGRGGSRTHLGPLVGSGFCRSGCTATM